MNRALVKHLSLCLLLSASFSITFIVSTAPSAEAARTVRAAKKKVTITDRVQELSDKIDAGQKDNELTLDEATDLHKKITKINEKIDKCQSKNGGKLSYKDQNSVEGDLNKVSVKLLKLQLAKRTAKAGH
jgi:peptidoglycan hydrolase CwlO-like protein